MPRTESSTLTTYWKIRIDASLAGRVEVALWDNTHKKPQYGSRKALIEHLLREWLQQQASMPAEEGSTNASSV